MVAPIHMKIADAISEDFHKGLIKIPRGHLKTSLISVGWVLWKLTNNPNLRFGIGSGTEDLASKILEEIIEHMVSNKRFIELYGSWENKNTWSKKEGITIAPRTKIMKDRTVSVFSVGKDPTGKHFDIIILDDVATRGNSNSPVLREGQFKLYKDCLNLLEPNGSMLFVGTNWHFNDLYNFILAKSQTALDFVIDEPCAHNDRLEELFPKTWKRDPKTLLLQEDTYTLFPEKFNKQYFLDMLQNVGLYEFSCQQMNCPVSEKDSAFRVEDMRFIKRSEIKEGLYYVILVDPAGIDTTYSRADDWAIVTLGVSMSGGTTLPRIYIMDVVAKSKISSNEFLTLLGDAVAKWNPGKIGLEVNFCKAYISLINLNFPQWAKRIIQIHAPTTASKAQRVRSLQPFTENEKFYIVLDDEIAKENLIPINGELISVGEGKAKLIDQMIDYGHMEHDDVIDAVANISVILKPKMTAMQNQNMKSTASYTPRFSKTGY